MSTRAWWIGGGLLAVGVVALIARRSSKAPGGGASADAGALDVEHTASIDPTALCPITYAGEPYDWQEQDYVADLSQAAAAINAAIPSRLRVSSATYLAELAARDPFWTNENIARREAVQDFWIFLADLAHHRYVWEHGGWGEMGLRPVDNRKVLNSCVTVVDLDFLRQTRDFEKYLSTWGNSLVQRGVIAAVPATKIRAI